MFSCILIRKILGFWVFWEKPMVVTKGKYCVSLPAFFLVGGRKLMKRKEQEGTDLFIHNELKQIF